MKNWPSLTCIFTTYNRKDFIRQSFFSILHQDYEGKLQIIASDDGSTDGTFEILQAMMQAYEGPHEVLVTQTPRNGRLAANVNYALRHAKYDWIVRHDDDDVASPYKCKILGWAIARQTPSLFILSEARATSVQEETASFPTVDLNHLSLERSPGMYGSCSDRDGEVLEAKCFSKKLWEQFGDLPDCAYYIDDLTFFLRARIQHETAIVRGYQTAILNYHDSNSSGPKNAPKTLRNIKSWEVFIDQYYTVSLPAFIALDQEIKMFIENAGVHQPHLDEHAVEPILNFITAQIHRAEFEAGWYSSCNTYQRFKRWLKMKKNPLYANNKYYFLFKVFPLILFAGILKIKHSLHGK